MWERCSLSAMLSVWLGCTQNKWKRRKSVHMCVDTMHAWTLCSAKSIIKTQQIFFPFNQLSQSVRSLVLISKYRNIPIKHV